MIPKPSDFDALGNLFQAAEHMKLGAEAIAQAEGLRASGFSALTPQYAGDFSEILELLRKIKSIPELQSYPDLLSEIDDVLAGE